MKTVIKIQHNLGEERKREITISGRRIVAYIMLQRKDRMARSSMIGMKRGGGKRGTGWWLPITR